MGKAKPIPAKNRRTVHDRSGGICEGCGKRPATDIHHRKYKSRGGSHAVENLLHLCGAGNHTGCHGVAHSAEGHELGWSVNSWDDPAERPAQLARYGVVWLTDTGTINQYPPNQRL